jgi:hypothetical protein
MGDWTPPARKIDGALIFDDWISIRAAIEAAYRALGREVPTNIPVDDWNLVGLAIEAYQHASRPSCWDCRARLWPSQIIRCLDCKAPLCERCAPKHFWPNGRP